MNDQVREESLLQEECYFEFIRKEREEAARYRELVQRVKEKGIGYLPQAWINMHHKYELQI